MQGDVFENRAVRQGRERCPDHSGPDWPRRRPPARSAGQQCRRPWHLGAKDAGPRLGASGDPGHESFHEQSVGLVKKVQPAAEIVREINEGAETILRRLAGT